MNALDWLPDGLITLGVIGGLLFIVLIIVLSVAVVVAGVLGYLGTRWYSDVLQVEAMDGKRKQENDK